ncbi:LuxR family transcriptional regulator [Methyloferula stellata]|uniref:LuxR family transcriptional regulator n=1 Tax=Methyloferula stellata TaxID=876270 RepID=UPI0003689B10|nr:LuxR family transcriptional regulator [Methyloferula stellata]
MSFAADEYGRRTFEFIEKLQQLQNCDEIQNLIVKELDWYGLTRVTSWSIPGPGDGPEGKVSLNTRPDGYIEHYLRHQYIDRDPVVTELRRSLSPFTWDDLRQNRRLTKAERRIMDEAHEFDSDDGFIIPIVTRSGSVALFSPCGLHPDLSPRARSALEIVGTYAHCALQRAMAQERRVQPTLRKPLTPREREIMRWVAAGKTDDEIGEILTIGRETVTTHVENAKVKLNATRRTYAVVQALRFGEIHL